MLGERFKTLRLYGPPAIVVTAGAAILYAQYANLNWISYIWPLFIILAGFPMLYIASRSEDAARVRLVFPGVIVTGTGTILLYQLVTSHWHSWTYAWALYAVFFGAGLAFQGQRLDIKSDVRSGRLMMAGGVAVFVLLWLLFETVIFGGQYQGVMGYMLAALLIGSGVVWGVNRFRVARVLNQSQVIHAKPPPENITSGAANGEQSAITRPEPVPPQKKDVNHQLEQRRQAMLAGKTAPTDGTAVTPPDDDSASAPDETSAPPASAATADEKPAETTDETGFLLDEYRPPTVALDDSAAPPTTIDPDLQARINAALQGGDDDENK